MDFTCRTCGQRHSTESISFGAEAPVPWHLISVEDRAKSELGAEQCVIESQGERHLFVRACLEIPIRGAEGSFSWGVWVSLSEKSFREMSVHWEDPARTALGPYFGWLCTKLPEYPSTLYLKTSVHQRPVGQRPLVELEDTDHPLSIDQRTGIDPSRLQQIISKLLHS